MSQLVDWQIEEQQDKMVQEAADLNRDEPAVALWPDRHGLIYPYEPKQLQPASYDLRLGRELRNEHGLAWNMREGESNRGDPLYEDMEPGRFMLGHTEEFIRMPAHLCGRVEGKSTIGRQGLAVHVTAGFIDPGFRGQITLELKHQGTLKYMKVWPGMLIAQITFHTLAARPSSLYGDKRLNSHYQAQLGATPPVK